MVLLQFTPDKQEILKQLQYLFLILAEPGQIIPNLIVFAKWDHTELLSAEDDSKKTKATLQCVCVFINDQWPVPSECFLDRGQLCGYHSPERQMDNYPFKRLSLKSCQSGSKMYKRIESRKHITDVICHRKNFCI